jgi:hypothetical protein
MRPAPPLGGLALVLALAGHAAAAPSPDKSYTATVTQDRAEVRCQPSTAEGCYVTNLLRRGERVKVLGDADAPGWLKIAPPAGSFSWVNTLHVEERNHLYHHWVVRAPNTGVRIGSSVVEKLPQMQGCVLQQGAIVQRYVRQGLVGRTQVDTESTPGTWLPIVPPPGEVRYLRKDAVAPATTAPPAPPAAPGATAEAGPARRAYPPPEPAPVAPPAPADPMALFLHAEQADHAGRIADAIGLYGRVVREGSASNPDLAEKARNRLNFLTTAGRHGPPPAQEPLAIRGEVPGEVVYGPTPEGRRYRPLTDAPEPSAPPAVRLAPPAATAASGSSGKTQTWTQPAGGTAPASGTTGESRQATGTLRSSGRMLDGVRAYALEGDGVRYYVIPHGVDLEPYVGQNVEISGPAVYKAELRANYIEALQVRPLR